MHHLKCSHQDQQDKNGKQNIMSIVVCIIVRVVLPTTVLPHMVSASLVSLLALASTETKLQEYHKRLPPAEELEKLAEACRVLGIDEWDMYGDFHKSNSFLREFESTIAAELGKEDAVFMPSGVMAQTIALLIHQRENRPGFACHHSSHLLIHEQEGYRKLAGMIPKIVSTVPISIEDTFPDIAPLTYDALVDQVAEPSDLSTLILELPHRELGGKCTPIDDIEKMRKFCDENDVAFHCDGARLFEATAFYQKSPAELSRNFDSVYLSFYKGLGGLSGAMLAGEESFCKEARVWLRRFGGNLFTFLPYIVSAMDGYERRWKEPTFSFNEKHAKLKSIIEGLHSEPKLNNVIRFDPPNPQVNMIHVFLKISAETCTRVLDEVANETGIRVLHRIREIPENDGDIPSGNEQFHKQGYQTRAEWTMGDANGSIDDAHYLLGWRAFTKALAEASQ